MMNEYIKHKHDDFHFLKARPARMNNCNCVLIIAHEIESLTKDFKSQVLFFKSSTNRRNTLRKI